MKRLLRWWHIISLSERWRATDPRHPWTEDKPYRSGPVCYISARGLAQMWKGSIEYYPNTPPDNHVVREVWK